MGNAVRNAHPIELHQILPTTSMHNRMLTWSVGCFDSGMRAVDAFWQGLDDIKQHAKCSLMLAEKSGGWQAGRKTGSGDLCLWFGIGARRSRGEYK